MEMQKKSELNPCSAQLPDLHLPRNFCVLQSSSLAFRVRRRKDASSVQIFGLKKKKIKKFPEFKELNLSHSHHKKYLF